MATDRRVLDGLAQTFDRHLYTPTGLDYQNGVLPTRAAHPDEDWDAFREFVR